MSTSIRQIASFIDNVTPPNSLRDVAKLHRWDSGHRLSSISMRSILNRHHHPNTVKVPFLSYNTYLKPIFHIPKTRISKVLGTLTGLFGIAPPEIGFAAGMAAIPDIIPSAPDYAARAKEIGKMLEVEARPKGVIAAFSEVWTSNEITGILNGWYENDPRREMQFVLGAQRDLTDLKGVGAGLMTIAVGYPIKRIESISFDERGIKTKDSDYFSSKGVLLAEIDLSPDLPANLEVYSTHLFNGGFSSQFDPEGDPAKLAREEARRLRTQLRQVDQLVEFVKQTHQPQNVAIVTGDFNIGARTNGYPHLTHRMNIIDMVDLWHERVNEWELKNGKSDIIGCTQSLDGLPFICKLDDSLKYCDDEASECKGISERSGESDVSRRIDYIFVEQQKPEHGIMVDFTRPRRRSFPRPLTVLRSGDIPRNGPYLPPSIRTMSDHIGLETTLILSPK